MVLINTNTICSQKFDCLGQNLPLRLFHDSTLQNFRRITLLDIDCLLKKDRAGIRSLIYEVDGSSRHLNSTGENPLVNLQPIESLSTEGRNQGGMDVNDLMRESTYDSFRNHDQEARQNDKIRIDLLQPLKESLIKGCSALKGLGDKTSPSTP